MELESIIWNLIQSKREGDYWDFKVEPHNNNAELLHDILCLANSLHKGNKYLIYGITNPESGCEIIGLSDNQTNRKNQSKFIDFLRYLKFAGDNRPEIELNSLCFGDKEIDVLIIKENINKPYYIIEDYTDSKSNNKDKVVRANYIYTRIGDTNTPINTSADIDKIEKMWKQRFGLDLKPTERMLKLLLSPEDWFKDIGNEGLAYHNNFSEYRIEFERPDEFYDAYSFFFTNNASYIGNAIFWYHSTKLFELQYIYCDEMRIIFSSPKIQPLALYGINNGYFYFDLSESFGNFLIFLTDILTNLNSRYEERFPFIIFNNKEERILFNQYISKNLELLHSFPPRFPAEHANERYQTKGPNTNIDPLFIDRILQLYDTWDYAIKIL